ncbi:MAG: hotdog domain-containing protein [Eubacteriales bacterium]|nr:hotdog domain-containing protein [Eubacteriales bacterium]
MSELVLPGMTNLLGNLLGGQLMHWMDVAGALCCMRHSNMQVVTVAVDALEFKHPARQGEMVRIEAKLMWIGQTSMKVKVIATAENLATGAVIITNVAKFTFVALDQNGQKTRVSALIPETDEEKQDYEKEEKEYLARRNNR